jgi:hypothetical protein
MEVAMSTLFIPTEDDAGNLSVCKFVKISVTGGEFQIAETQLISQADAGWDLANYRSIHRHVPYNRRM